jgi:hypothetical protein
MILMKFDVSAAVGQSFTTATLNIYAYSDGRSKNNFKLVSDDSWTENGVTWNNAPSAGTTAATVTINESGYTWISIDVSSIALESDGTFSLIIQGSGNSTSALYVESGTAYIDVQ